MSTQLVLRIEEHWPSRPVAAWVLLGPDGKVRSEGESDPRHWPAADECIILLAGTQCLWLETRLPRAARRNTQRLLAYALEDRLLSDPDTQHLTVTHRNSAGENEENVGVVVVARDRLRVLMAQFKALGRTPGRCVSELQTAPFEKRCWHIAISADTAIVRVGPDSAYATDAHLLDAVLEAQLASARTENAEPDQILVHRMPGTGDAGFHPRDGYVEAGNYHWWSNADRADNLLQGEFAVSGRRSGWLPVLRAPLLLAGIAGAVWMLAAVGEVVWRSHVLGDIETRMKRTFETSFPNQPAVAPAAQMRQQLDLERARRGMLRSDDGLSLLSAVADALGNDAVNSLAGLQFAEGRMDLRWQPDFSAERLDRLQSELKARGLLAEMTGETGALHLLIRTEALQ